MEDLSKLLLEERAHSEQFKANFIQLKIEFDKYCIQNNFLVFKLSIYFFLDWLQKIID
jgi:hypothetical protein